MENIVSQLINHFQIFVILYLIWFKKNQSMVGVKVKVYCIEPIPLYTMYNILIYNNT